MEEKASVAVDSDNSSYLRTRRKFWRSILMGISCAVRAVGAILVKIRFATFISGILVTVIGGILVIVISAPLKTWFLGSTPETNDAVPDDSQAFVQEAPGTVCRDFEEAEHDTPVEIAPCIASYRDGLKISVNVKAREPVTVTAHVWLRDKESEQRFDDTLEACTLTFATAGEFQRCGPFSVRPVPSGRYVTATDVQKGRAIEFPLKWNDLSVTGLLSKGGLYWPPG
ncbi:MAG: hypothetical protein ACT4NY_27785 [Pseudonocardiales bacterium]